MHNIFIEEKEKTLFLPENATELSQEQLLQFCELLLHYKSGLISFTDLKIKAAKAFLNLKRVANLSLPENQTISENLLVIAELLDYFFIKQQEGEMHQLHMLFYMQKLSFVKIGSRKYYGPTDALLNTTYGEYLKLIDHFEKYSSTGDVNELDAMIATIYRPKKRLYYLRKKTERYDGDIRRVYNENHTNTYAKHLAKLPMSTKYAIYLFVASSQHFIANNTQLKLGEKCGIDLTVLFTSSVGSTNNNIGMVGTLFSLAETNVFGTVKEVAKENTYDILVYLAKQAHQYNELKNKKHASTS